MRIKSLMLITKMTMNEVTKWLDLNDIKYTIIATKANENYPHSRKYIRINYDDENQNTSIVREVGSGQLWIYFDYDTEIFKYIEMIGDGDW